jgi:hypothetical protein
MKRLTVSDFLVIVGGEQHSGWLPENATKPLPVPIRELPFDFVIEETIDGGGYLLEYQSHSGELYGDTWHETLEDAKAQAQQYFGVPVDAWQEE